MKRKKGSQQLQHTVTLIQRRWGPTAIQKLAKGNATVKHPVLSTGFRSVDRMLGVGGIPKGRVTELVASGTAGQATLAAKTLRQAQRAGQQVVYVDVHHTVDLDFLARCDVRFDSLVILQPWGFRQALEMSADLIREGGAGAMVFDRLTSVPPEPDAFRLLDRALREWTPFLDRSRCALLFLTEVASLRSYPSDLSLPYFTGLRMLFERQDWLYRRRRVTGFVSKVTVLKNKFGASGQSALVKVQFTNHIHSGEDE